MVIILRGIAGSGKSRLVEHFIRHRDPKEELSESRTPAEKFLDSLRQTVYRTTYSADDYFMVNGEYKFDPRYLPAAHQTCLRTFGLGLMDSSTIGLGDKTHTLVVDNTNTTLVEVLPYVALAEAFSHELHVVTLVKDPIECLTRNRHGVPFSSIIKQDIFLRQSIIDWPGRLAMYQQIFHE